MIASPRKVNRTTNSHTGDRAPSLLVQHTAQSDSAVFPLGCTSHTLSSIMADTIDSGLFGSLQSTPSP